MTSTRDNASFDVFVSYKHAAYSPEATEITKDLERLGLRCFLDTREGLSDLDDRDLAEYLRGKLEGSLLVVFFETYSEQLVAVARVVGGEDRLVDSGKRPSWQEFELQQLGPERYIVLYHSATPKCIQVGLAGEMFVYDSLEDAAYRVSQHLQRQSRPPQSAQR